MSSSAGQADRGGEDRPGGGGNLQEEGVGEGGDSNEYVPDTHAARGEMIGRLL